MAKFTIELFPEGDRVKIVGGDYAGHTGTVAGYSEIGLGVVDVIHVVNLDDPADEQVQVPLSLLSEQ